jgi:hypothetical protein
VSGAASSTRKAPREIADYVDPIVVVIREGAVVHFDWGSLEAGQLLVLEREDAESLIEQGVADRLVAKGG